MELNAKARLQAGTSISAATAKEAAAYLTQTFKKHGLNMKVTPSDKMDTALKCVEKTKYGEIWIELYLNFKKSGATFIDVDVVAVAPFNIDRSLRKGGDDFDLTKLGKTGAKEFKKFALNYAKQANAIRDQLVFAGEWITKFAAALQEINEAMAANKTKVGKEFR